MLGAGDVEAALIATIEAELSAFGLDAVVSTSVYDTSGLFVRVQRQGGSRANLGQDRARISVECWGQNEEKASRLASVTESIVFNAWGQPAGDLWIDDVESVGGIVYREDEETCLPRYQFTVSVTTGLEEL